MRRRVAALAAFCLLLSSLGGCTVTTSRRPAFDSPVAIEVQKSQKLHLDLRDHPTRAETGIPDSGNSVAYGRRAPGYLDVRLQLPEDKVLELPATDATIAALRLRGRDRAEPDYVLLVRIEPDAAAAEQVLRAEAERFSFEPDAVERAVERARERSLGLPMVLETQVGHITFSISVRTNVGDDTRVQLSYALSWDPEGTPGVAPTPSA